MKKYLYSFENTLLGSKTFDGGAPRLVPPGSIIGSGGNFLSKDSPGFEPIDVINEFQWTTSPPSSRRKVPNIILKEKRLKNNALYAQVAYYGLALGQAGAGGLGNLAAAPSPIKEIVGGVVGGFLGGKLSELSRQIQRFVNIDIAQPIQSILDLATRAGGAAAGYNIAPETIMGGVNTVIGLLQEAGKDLPSQFNLESLNSDVLRPYEGLYITDDTKFLYNFPYFSDAQNYISNMFGDYDEVMSMGGLDPIGGASLAGGLREASSILSGVVNFDAPGIYIEKPKFFNFKETGEEISFRLPLINTGWATFDDVSRNWQLMYMLSYQNRPNRKTRNLIDPAVIYEITIPGVRFYPYAYISEMAINFVGARRRMELRVPVAGGQRTISTIVPDAYVIDIKLTTLVSETQNFLYALLHDKQDVITTSSQVNPFDRLQTEIMQSYDTEYYRNLNPATRSGFNTILQNSNEIIRSGAGGSGMQGGSLP